MIAPLLLLATLAASPGRAALTKTAELYLDKGLHHLYNLDYSEARADFRKIIEAEPDNPFGYLFESGAIWWQSSMEYGLFKDTPTLQGLFEQDVEAALRKVDPLEASSDKKAKADGHFVEGMALGTRGQWGIMRGHWLKAYFDGKKAVKHLRKAVKIDDRYYDAELGLGVFDYEAAHFGGVLKLGAALGGVHGDEKRGLEELQLASEKGRFGARQSAQFLASIHIYDRRYASALPIIQRLRRDFPESVYFEFLETALRFKLGDRLGSLDLGRDVFDKVKDDPASLNRKMLSLVCGFAADQCLNRQDVTAAATWLDLAIETAAKPGKPKAPPKKGAKGPSADEQWLSLLHLYRGYCDDILGQPDASSTDYRWTLDHADFSDNRARAKECLSQSCEARDILVYFRALSHGEPWPPQ